MEVEIPHWETTNEASDRELNGWGENIIRQGRSKLQMVIRIYTTRALASWVMRDYRPTGALMTQGLVLRCLAGPMRSKNGRVAFNDGMDFRPENKKRTEESPDPKSQTRRVERRETVFATSASQRSVFRRRGAGFE